MELNFDELLKEYLKENISIQEFRKLFQGGNRFHSEKIIRLLNTAKNKKDGSEIELLLIVASIDGFSTEYSNILCELLQEKWHDRHEDILSYLMDVKNPDTAKCIYNAVFKQLSNLEDNETITWKAIKALSFIGGEKSMGYIKELSNSENENINKIAKKELQRLEN